MNTTRVEVCLNIPLGVYRPPSKVLNATWKQRKRVCFKSFDERCTRGRHRAAYQEFSHSILLETQEKELDPGLTTDSFLV